VVEIGGDHLDSAGYDILGLVCGSSGAFATSRIT